MRCKTTRILSMFIIPLSPLPLLQKHMLFLHLHVDHTSQRKCWGHKLFGLQQKSYSSSLMVSRCISSLTRRDKHLVASLYRLCAICCQESCCPLLLVPPKILQEEVLVIYGFAARDNTWHLEHMPECRPAPHHTRT